MSARISMCGLYRWTLTRTVDPFEMRRALFLGLNPSRADAIKNDPTINRLTGFCRLWGVGEYTVANVYGLRSPSPKDLWKAFDPVGFDNDSWIAFEAQKVDTVVVMWGAHAKPDRVAKVWELIRSRPQVLCFGRTKSGAPKHPLYLPSDTKLVPWQPKR